MLDQLEAATARVAPDVQQWSVRGLVETSESLNVRQDVPEAPRRQRDAGVMVSVVDRGGLGFAATGDASDAGLARAFEQARAMAHASASNAVFDATALPWPDARGSYRGPTAKPASSSSLRERLDRVRAACASAGAQHIVERSASLQTVDSQQLLLTSRGARIEQQFAFVMPSLQATAQVDGVTQTRSAAGQYNGFCQQGGLEVLDRSAFDEDGPRVAREAVELARAPQCPTGTMDVLLMPDQMMIQIHESIGHPLELDRILGDERNFAGTSFVTLEMFGSYAYGSELLNVSYDPTRSEQLASFAYDDDGTTAERQLVIERGRLLRPLGGSVSQARARALGHALPGVATTRASSWNRAPIDRMSNLNVEPGDASLEQMIAGIEHGVLLQTNCSWSIDDSRNKFQFGCERGQMIRHGKLAEVVRNPNYRGISATFWRSLAQVGNGSTFQVMGTPYCGKGEPSQIIRVGHASPACRFNGVSVFGGDAA